MSPDQIIITISGLFLIAGIVWFFWLSEGKAVKVETKSTGFQEALITVKGGYSPDILIFQAGKPIRINFHREETALCSEEVIFPDLNVRATLTPFKTIPLDLKIDKPGTYNFQCGMGMLKGKLIVE